MTGLASGPGPRWLRPRDYARHPGPLAAARQLPPGVPAIGPAPDLAETALRNFKALVSQEFHRGQRHRGIAVLMAAY